jgi:predicted transcriptional regulator
MMLTPLELDIMKAVWRRRPITVRDVHAALHPSRKLAYTTVMTIMDRLYHKGFLTRRLESRAHLYEPAITYSQVRDDALNALIRSFFDGSRENLQEFLRTQMGGFPAKTSVETASRSSLDETLL